MIEKKLEKLKSLMSDLDQDKLQNSHKIDSISLISQNLSRTNKSTYTPKPESQPLSQTTTLPKQTPHKLTHKTQSLNLPFSPSPSSSPRKSPQKSPRQLLNLINETNKNKIISLAHRLYKARCVDLEIKESQVGWEEFLKIFLGKNSRYGEFRGDRVDLGGLGIGRNCMAVVNQIILEYRAVDLSRNIIKTSDLLTLPSTKKLQQLSLQNCSMKNSQLCHLFLLLLPTPLKKLSLCSPNIKDRNNLTRYDQLYQLLQQSQTLECLELSNIQISPQCQLFAYVRKSVSMRRLDVSKNTGVEGMCRNLVEVDLSWNGIKRTGFLRCVEAALEKLDLTGNPIPPYLFQDSFNTNNYAHLKHLILDKIQINYEAVWLQTFIQKSKSIQKLSLVDCQLSKTTLLNVIYGLQHNKSLKSLNLSNNKIPATGVAQHFVTSLKASNLSHLYLQLCQITDECGSILFQCLSSNPNIEHIDISKNMIGQKSSETICNCLKNGCYSLLALITTQNFIKYDQLKEIVGYIGRNVYMAKMKVLDEYRKCRNVSANGVEALRRVEEAERRVRELREETLRMEDQYMKKQKDNECIDALILQQQIKLLSQQQQHLLSKKTLLEKQLTQINSHHVQQNQS